MAPHELWPYIQSWLHACDRQHAHKDSPTTHPDHDLPNPPNMLLIDVQELRLVAFEAGTRYVALSYVCGPRPSFRNTKKQLQRLSKVGGLRFIWAELPSTVQQAIVLTKVLGERYLWADTPCIVMESKQAQLRALHDIYRGAVLTTVAAQGADGDAGLLSSLEGRSTQQSDRGHSTHSPAKDGPQGCLGLMRGPWFERAWTLQEWLMSSRMLLFSEAGIFWHCTHRTNSLHVRHDIEISTMDYDVNLFRDQWNRFRLACCLGPPTKQPASIPDDASDVFGLYKWVVETYTRRRLSFAEDVLDAFHGLSIHLGKALQCPMVQGLPVQETLFCGALLWRGTNTSQGQGRRSGFPSWSWTGTLHAITYDYLPEFLRHGIRDWPLDGWKGSVPQLSAQGSMVQITSRTPTLSAPNAPLSSGKLSVDRFMEGLPSTKYLQIRSWTGQLPMTKGDEGKYHFTSSTGKTSAEVCLDAPSDGADSQKLLHIILIPPSPRAVSVFEDTVYVDCYANGLERSCARPTYDSYSYWAALAIRWRESHKMAERIGVGWVRYLCFDEMAMENRDVTLI